MSKMTDIKLNEVSAVDYPAHMVHGFAVMKSTDPDKTEALLRALRKEEMPDLTPDEVVKTLSAEDIIKALSDEQRAEFEKAFGKKKPLPEDEADGGADDDNEDAEGNLKKSLAPEVRVLIEKTEKQNAELMERIQKSEETTQSEIAKRLDTEAINKSEKEYTNLGFDHAKVAPALRKFAAVDASGAEAITEMLKAVNAQADGAIFKTLGTDADGAGDVTPYGQLEALAKARSEEDGISIHKARELVYGEKPELVNAYYKENR